MKITVNTSLLLAVSRWASSDDTRPHLGNVLFRPDEMIACDGHRLVRVPLACAGLTVAVDRKMIAAAAAAQEFCKDSAPRDNEYTGRAVELTVDGDHVTIGIGRFSIRGRRGDHAAYPPIDQVMPRDAPAGNPDGYGFDPKYLAAIHDVQVAAGAQVESRGVRVAKWSADKLGPMLFTGYNGIRYVIMPVRV